MRNQLIFCLILLSVNSQAQKYKGWYLGFTGGVGHTYFHNKNFDYYIKSNGLLAEDNYYYRVKYLRGDKIFNAYQLSIFGQKEFRNGYGITGVLSYASQTSTFYIGLNGQNLRFSAWFPDQSIMKEFPSTTKMEYIQGQLLFGKSFIVKKDYALEAKFGLLLGYLANATQKYSSNNDTLSTFYAEGNKQSNINIAKVYYGLVAVNNEQYSKSYFAFNSFIPGIAFECNVVGKLGAGKGQFEKWRYKIGIYGNADLKDVEGNADTYFMPPKYKYPNAPSLSFRGGIQFGLSYHFNKR